MGRWLPFLSLLLALSVTCGIARPARAVEITDAEMENRRCLACHGQARMATLSPEDRASMLSARAPTTGPATRPGIYLGESNKLHSSVHASLSCVKCHTDVSDLPHAQHLKPADCTSCHTTPGRDFMQGVHADAAAKGDPKAPTCVTCHGGHDVLPKRDRESRTFPLNLVKVCGDCHQSHSLPDGRDPKANVDKYLASVHGQAVMKGGMAVAATCADCHGSHRVLAATDTRSKVNRQNLSNTCGKCHVGVSETYNDSVHAKQLLAGNDKAAVCVDCHTAHAITRVDAPAFMLDIVNECGTCHNKPQKDTGTFSLYESYRRSYHGQVNALGMARAARCSDCHGNHNVQKVDDPRSTLFGAQRIETCRKCHPTAGPKFAEFAPHADFHDTARYPVLHYVFLYFVVVMSCSFGFFGLHSILWFARNLIDRVKHGPYPRHHAHGTAIRRFSRVDRINHAFVIISFFGLALTGLPLIYHDRGWGKTLANLFGGAHAAGVLHRVFALMLIANFVVHGVGVLKRVRQHGLLKLAFGPTTMLPTPKDLKDALGMFKWFFVGGKKPRFDRWTYYEKFDYVAEVGGSGVIAVSGLLLWFPAFFATFLPGWIFNVATLVHGYEALLAVVFIFTIHFFNAHLRFEKFPVDDVMFTGRLSEEEFKEERPAEYDRLVATGQLESLRAPAPHKYYRVFAVAMGLLAMAIGFTIAALIIWAGIQQVR